MPSKILLIDDDPLVLKSLTNLLTAKGYQITGCKSGWEAIRLFNDGIRFGLIITDVRMPGVDGIQTIKRIREIEENGENGQRTPIIVITGYSDEAAYLEAERLGVNGYFHKPFDAFRLLDGVSKCISTTVSDRQ